MLGETHCGWRLRNWDSPELGVVGARPCSPGGGFYLSPEMLGVFGPISVEESANRIAFAADEVPHSIPLIILAHSGPTGLGSDAYSPCGRDWKVPALDWGDKDLELAIDKIRKRRVPDLVVFGHMHHSLRRGSRIRSTFAKDHWGTFYLNAASVPRHVKDPLSNDLIHFSWVEFMNRHLIYVAHRWYLHDASIASEEVLLDRRSQF